MTDRFDVQVLESIVGQVDQDVPSDPLVHKMRCIGPKATRVDPVKDLSSVPLQDTIRFRGHVITKEGCPKV